MVGKNIVLLCDGTGNSAASLSKTNVWRLYQSLDLTARDANGKPLQIARYSDGVGTSSFKPLALVGGIFGVGLARNVVDMYKFLCRNYEAGDHIYAFGFSRGAFTARILIDLICDQGVIRHANDEELERLAADAWRTYRRQYKLPLWGDDRDYTEKDRNKTVGLVDVVRNLRDGLLRSPGRRRLRYDTKKNERVPEIKFIGVWDTVAAYGLPLDELTRGIDDWVWPLSMTNYRLSDKVTMARHALALDEERDSFHPLLWEEPEEGEQSRTDLLQVWFPGVHSNVGGGYPDDTLSRVPLAWMKGEAAAAGLLLRPADINEPDSPASPLGRMYDSRAGVAGYYRLQPRKLRALLHNPPPDTKLLQDPKQKGKGFLKRVVVHHSVLDRIREGADRYAPFGLPADFSVLNADGSISPWSPVNGGAVDRANRQEWVWNDVWRRRVTYFTTVFVSLLLAALPWFKSYLPQGECTGPQCLLSPVIKNAGNVLPSLFGQWVDVFAAYPGIFLVFCLLIATLMGHSQVLRHRVWDRSRRIWAETLDLPIKAGSSTSGSLPDDWIYRLRSAPRYQSFMQRAKWQWLSGTFGLLVLFLGSLAVLSIPFQAVSSIALLSGSLCRDTGASPDGTLHTKESCHDTGESVTAQETYHVRLVIGEPWRDRQIPATPRGNIASAMPSWMPLFVPFRRHLNEPWFALMARVGASGWNAEAYHLDWRRECAANCEVNAGSGTGEVWVARLTPRQSGRLFLYVNDADLFYGNNLGTATVLIKKVQ
jgi:uncharacterized protein (DUF2235 family)